MISNHYGTIDNGHENPSFIADNDRDVIIVQPSTNHVDHRSKSSSISSSTSSTFDRAMAVQTRDVCFGFTKNRPILHNVSINVRSASIYGLLGPSGCGKTSLLRCILGQLKPKSGSIVVLGRPPGAPGSLVPGPGAGYMPQELALYSEFTVRETVSYFGKLYAMSKESIVERSHFLIRFLHLTSVQDQLCRDLSGGQKRRVSLAAALVHSPPLVILDEPTVGVDPLLREK